MHGKNLKKLQKLQKKPKLFEIIAKSWQISNAKCQKCPKIWKNAEQFGKLVNLAKSWQN